MSNESKPTPAAGRGLRIALWMAQGLLAFMFAMAGTMKATQPIEELAKLVPWTPDVPLVLVRFIGVVEVLGAFGLILPAVTRIRPNLTGFAGAGLLTVMVLAVCFHASRGEYQAIIFNLMLGAVAALVAWGRLFKAPITRRES